MLQLHYWKLRAGEALLTLPNLETCYCARRAIAVGTLDEKENLCRRQVVTKAVIKSMVVAATGGRQYSVEA